MRKITNEIRKAFQQGNKLTIGNTTTDGTCVWLRGSKIIERREDGIYFNFCGWASSTTKERINGVLLINCHIVKGQLHRCNVPISSTEWHKN